MAVRWDLFAAFIAGLVIAGILISGMPALIGLQPIRPQPAVEVQ
jgi:hypothetical protein